MIGDIYNSARVASFKNVTKKLSIFSIFIISIFRGMKGMEGGRSPTGIPFIPKHF
jgi:hypothetical protein